MWWTAIPRIFSWQFLFWGLLCGLHFFLFHSCLDCLWWGCLHWDLRFFLCSPSSGPCSVLSDSSKLSSSIFLFFTYCFSFFSLASLFVLVGWPSFPLLFASSSQLFPCLFLNKLCTCNLFMCFSFSFASLAWAGASLTSLSFVTNGSKLILSCAALTNFLSKNFLASIVLVASATSSLPFPPLNVDSCRPVSIDFFLGDLLKNEVIGRQLDLLVKVVMGILTIGGLAIVSQFYFIVLSW